jgi:hypothetical protein
MPNTLKFGSPIYSQLIIEAISFKECGWVNFTCLYLLYSNDLQMAASS